jgi:raffinose/stachyose/melibiose transport system substrate-binding protein
VKLTLWLQSDNSLDKYFTDNIVAPFNAQSKTAQVEVTLQANRWDAIRTALAGGAGPDLVGTPGPSFAAQLARAGFLLPLDSFSTQLGWDKNVLPWALSLGQADGKLYSIPDGVETVVLYYNKTLFEKNGWQPPKTMEELTALCEKIKAAGVIPFAHANAEYRGANEWYVGEFLNHIAGPEKVYQALTGQIKWTDPAFETAISTLNTFQQKGWFMGGLDRYYTLTFAERDAMLASGKAAMNIEGTWFMSSALGIFGEKNSNPNEWDWVPMPSVSGDAIYDLGIGGSWSINKSTKYPDAAAEFLTYYYQPSVQAALPKAGFNAGPVKLSAEDMAGVDPRFAAILEALGQASAKGDYGYLSWAFYPPKTEAYLVDIEKVWSGELTPAKYLEGMQKQFEEEFAAKEVPPIPQR